jgi:ring-1,2-phenylacetyl-CoA epoxidase subunit PaaE
MSLHFHPLTVTAVHPEGQDAVAVSLAPRAKDVARFAFEPGQYLTVRAQVAGEELRRSYSICAAAGEPLRVGVRKVAGGAFSPWLHERLRVGDTLDAMPPQGHFGRALQGRPRQVLLVAGGSGVTPLLSILKTLLEGDAKARATRLYGNRSAASTMFKEELEDLKNGHLARLALHPVFSRETGGALLHTGRIDAPKIATVLRLAGGFDQAFVCGPHAMNDAAEAALLQAGLAPEQVHIERFGIPPAQADAPPPAHAPGDAATARISIVLDGLTRELAYGAHDTNILDAAARAGLDVPYSCKSGVCATCRARVLEGRVRMDRNFAREKSELEAGFVLACQAHPLTERVRLSFDHR